MLNSGKVVFCLERITTDVDEISDVAVDTYHIGKGENTVADDAMHGIHHL